MSPKLTNRLIVFAMCALYICCQDLSKSDFLDADMESGEVSWVVQISGPSWEETKAVGVLSGGDIVATGWVETAGVDFALGGGNPESSMDDVRGMFAARYAASGAFTWVKTIQQCSSSEGNDVAIASDGAPVVVGRFWEEADFGEDETGATCFLEGRADTGFIVKYGVDGQLLWARHIVTTNGDQKANGIDADTGAGGNLYVMVGDFTGDAVFGSGETLETTLVTDPGDRSLFIAAYEKDGNLVWAKQATGETSGSDVAFLPDGTIVVVGTFSEQATLGPGDSQPTILESNGSSDAFIARYASDGTLIYAKAIGGVQSDEGIAVAPLESGAILVGGGFEGSLTLGTGEATETTLNAAGKKDVYLATYAAVDGALHWASRIGGAGIDEVWDLAAIDNGGFLVVGGFQETARFGYLGEVEINLASNGDFDIYAARFDSAGNLLGVRRDGGPGHDSARAVSAPSSNSAVIAGLFEGGATFGAGEPGETQLQGDGVDSFIMRVEF